MSAARTCRSGEVPISQLGANELTYRFSLSFDPYKPLVGGGVLRD